MDAYFRGSQAPGTDAPDHLDEAHPLKDKRHSDQAVAFQGQGKADTSNSTDTTAKRKAWKNLQARCLLAGFGASLIDGDDGQPLLVVTRWALCKSFTTMSDAEAWLVRVAGVPHG